MGNNLIGPFGPGVNQSYDTPSFPDSGDNSFSWFVDCTDDVTPDGTRFTANWANRVMQQIRRAVVGMGIAPAETDGDALQKAIMRAHRPIVNVGGGAGLHKGEKMPEWHHELRSIVGAGTVSVQVDGDTVVISGAAGQSVTLQSVGTGVPIYKGISGSIHQFRSIVAEAGLAVVEGPNHATFRLAPIPGWSILMRNGASADVPAGVAIDELTEEASPAVNDYLMLQRNPGRQLRKVRVGALRSKGLVGQGTAVLDTDTSAWGSPSAVISGTIPASPIGPSTIAFSASIRISMSGDSQPMSYSRAHLRLSADTGGGFVDVEPEAHVEYGRLSNEGMPTSLDIVVPLVGHVVDAPSGVDWRFGVRTTTPGSFVIRAQSRVTWLQFA